MSKKKIGVICGGKSSEKEVSLATGRYIFNLLDPELFEGVALYLDSQGILWEIPQKLLILNKTADIEKKLASEASKVHFEDLPGKVDILFNALFGKYGEDGVIQGIFELIGIPYTGSGILASAVGMNKRVHKRLLSYKGFKVPRDVVIEKRKWERSQQEYMKKIEEELHFPCVVKPVCEGSSVGVSVPKTGIDLIKAIEQAFYWDPEVLVEEYIRGREFMCVVWGNESPEAMLPTEVEFEGDFHTYESKYMPGRAKYFTPIRVPDSIISEIQKQAVSIYELIGARGYGRVDGYVVEKDGEFDIYIGEPHTGTIMVPSSYVFQQAVRTKVETKTKIGSQKMPLNPRRLVTRILEFAEEAHKQKKGYL